MKSRSFFLYAVTLLVLGSIRSHAMEPLLEYKFDTQDDGTVESSGSNTLELSMSGATLSPDGVSGKPGDAALDTSASGADGMAISPHAVSLPPLKSFTLLGWIKDVPPPTNLQGRIFCWRSPKGGIDFGVERGLFVLGLGGEDGAQAILSLGKEYPEMGGDSWVCFAVIWNGEDGVVRLLVGTDKDHLEEWASASTEVKTIAPADTLLAIGNSSGGTRTLGGKLDDIRLFASKNDGSGALSEDSIKEYFAKDRH